MSDTTCSAVFLICFSIILAIRFYFARIDPQATASLFYTRIA